jgi:hypothetical protein
MRSSASVAAATTNLVRDVMGVAWRRTLAATLGPTDRPDA